MLEKLSKRMDEVRQREVINPVRGNASPLACKAVLDNGGRFGPFLSEAEWWQRFHNGFSDETAALDDPDHRYGITDEDITRMENASAGAARRRRSKQNNSFDRRHLLHGGVVS